MARHVMTPARRAALRKAQLASARKRKRVTNVKMYSQYQRRQRKTRWQNRAVIAGRTAQVVGVTALAGYGAYKFLTPPHRAYVDRKFSSAGQKIKSKYRSPHG